MILNNNKNTGFGSISGGGSSGGGTGGVDKIYVDGLTNSLKNSKFDKVEYDATDNSLVFYANNVEKARVVLPAGSGREIELKYEDDKIKYKYSDETNFTELVDLSTIAGSGGALDTDMLTMNAVGGIPVGSNLNGKTALEIINDMFFPYTKPSVSIALTKTPTATIVEKGTSISITDITATVGKKSEKITNVQFFINNAMVENLTSGVDNGGVFKHTPINPVIVTDSVGASYIQVKVTDNKGGITTTNGVALDFVYPFYHGTVSNGAVIDSALITGLTKDVSKKGAKTYTYTTSNSCMVIAFPKSYSNLASIIDPNGFNITDSFSRQEVNVTANDSTTQVYNVYVSGSNTNSGFTVKFNF